MDKEQKLRALLFYTCVISFFIIVPSALLYSFGYKLDFKKFRFTKTGLIFIKTVPEGAKVFLEGRQLVGSTPLSAEGLTPGSYRVFLESEGYYPWKRAVSVWSGETTYLDTIVLFPKKPFVDKVNNVDVANFWVFPHDQDSGYFISDDKKSLYKINLASKDHEMTLVAESSELVPAIHDFSFSPDKRKILFFNDTRLDIVFCGTERIMYQDIANNNFYILADGRIWSAFWYSDGEHVVVVTDKTISIYELSSQGRNNTISILKLRDSRSKASYDLDGDILYFTDLQKGTDDRWHRGLYRLDLRKRSPFSFIKNIQDNRT
ncbi:MAG TPA: PEGA domain-containing protein [Candidatus Omnitrophota bacterium]|nr:PEGA domain-containing protein [Candidatus Omnitrophota bacterium]HPT06850.1 PEGA domain-containing protein [Candidatus Omnitrophota bacterium]